MLAKINTYLKPLYMGALDNREHWQHLDDLYREGSYLKMFRLRVESKKGLSASLLIRLRPF